jgi:hypothetical protein
MASSLANYVFDRGNDTKDAKMGPRHSARADSTAGIRGQYTKLHLAPQKYVLDPVDYWTPSELLSDRANTDIGQVIDPS